MKTFCFSLLALLGSMGLGLCSDEEVEFSPKREWSNAEGTAKFEGTLKKLKGDKVTIQREGKGGKLVTLPLDKLSEADKTWMEENKEAIEELSSASPFAKKEAKMSSIGEEFSKVKTINKKKIKLEAKNFIILYSASWCPPCRAEMPHVVTLYKEKISKEKDLELVLVSFDQSKEAALAWAEKEDMPFPIISRESLKKVDCAQKYEPNGIPSGVLLKASKEGHELIRKGLPSALFQIYEGKGK